MLTTKRRYQARRGKTSADDFNDFQDEAIHDLNTLDQSVASMRNDIAVPIFR